MTIIYFWINWQAQGRSIAWLPCQLNICQRINYLNKHLNTHTPNYLMPLHITNIHVHL